LAAVSTQIDNRFAIAEMDCRSAASSTIDIRNANRCRVVPARSSRVSSTIWAGVNSI